MNAAQKLALCRTLVEARFPYLQDALLGMIPVEVPGLRMEAMSADGRFFWDPLRWATISIADGEFGVAHELLHWVLDTPARIIACGCLHHHGNITHDCIINYILRDAHMVPSPSDVFAELYGLPREAGMWTFERLVWELAQRNTPAPPMPRCGGGWCGSGGGLTVPGEPEPEDGLRGRAPVEVQEIRARVAQSIQSAKQAGRGSIPGGLAAWAIEQLGPPKIRWQDHLVGLATSSLGGWRTGASQHSYRKLPRRGGQSHLIMPGTHNPKPRVLLWVDTSGSMGLARRQAVLAEVAGLLADVELEVGAVDAAVQSAPIGVQNLEQVWGLMRGGGGTNFCPAFEHTTQLPDRPALVIVATDGDGTAPTAEPPFETIWLLVGGRTTAPASWGQTVVVPND